MKTFFFTDPLVISESTLTRVFVWGVKQTAADDVCLCGETPGKRRGYLPGNGLPQLSSNQREGTHPCP